MGVDSIGQTSENSQSNSSNSANKKNNEMDKDAFLQLMVAELKNQDPLSPMDSKDTMAQLAQFSSLEQMTNMATAMQTLSNTIAYQGQMTLFAQASSLIGKEVTWADEDGKTHSGIVDSVGWGDDGLIKLKIGDQVIDLEAVGIVSAPPEPDPDPEGGDGTGGTGDGKDDDEIKT